ncbi:MAG: hypothetical protein WD273_14110 [Trueperaceae bacterium]
MNGNSSVVYEMRLSSSNLDDQAVYFELDTDLDLYVYNENGSLFATSSGPEFFGSGDVGLQSLVPSSTGFEPLAVRASLICRGSCVIRDANSSLFYVRIGNPTSSQRAYSLFAYTDQYEDVGEFENDTPSGAVTLQVGEETGAIESIGDVDYYSPAVTGQLRFATSATVNIQAVVIDSNSRRIDVPLDEPFEVFPSDLIEVTVLNDDEAAVSANSLYFLTLE